MDLVSARNRHPIRGVNLDETQHKAAFFWTPPPPFSILLAGARPAS
jgi:hypothetical protein